MSLRSSGRKRIQKPRTALSNTTSSAMATVRYGRFDSGDDQKVEIAEKYIYLWHITNYLNCCAPNEHRELLELRNIPVDTVTILIIRDSVVEGQD